MFTDEYGSKLSVIMLKDRVYTRTTSKFITVYRRSIGFKLGDKAGEYDILSSSCQSRQALVMSRDHMPHQALNESSHFLDNGFFLLFH
jgi:hypothetical protein